MGVTVSVNNPSFPEGTVMAIDHLGEIQNGGSIEVTEEQERAFITNRGQTIEDAFEGNEVVKVSGSSSVDNVDELIGEPEKAPTEEVKTPTETPPDTEGTVS